MQVRIPIHLAIEGRWIGSPRWEGQLAGFVVASWCENITSSIVLAVDDVFASSLCVSRRCQAARRKPPPQIATGAHALFQWLENGLPFSQATEVTQLPPSSCRFRIVLRFAIFWQLARSDAASCYEKRGRKRPRSLCSCTMSLRCYSASDIFL